jgi:hypothetical protein
VVEKADGELLFQIGRVTPSLRPIFELIMISEPVRQVMDDVIIRQKSEIQAKRQLVPAKEYVYIVSS